MPIQPLNFAGQAADSIGVGRNRVPPSSSGDGSRQSKVPPNRIGFHKRNLVRWFIPETGIIDMYINPASISTADKKIISDTRTKGGYVMQYWGEEKTILSISGTTGSSGIEGINVLFDVYRSEQVAFDPFALAFAASLDSSQSDDTFLGDSPGSILSGLASGIGESFTDQVTNSLASGSVNPTRPRPTLASLAFSVEMYWSGWTYRGYFTDFKLTEAANNLGLFQYDMTFVATQRRGYRANFLPWHRSPTSGPSNSDPTLGVPYSYSGLSTEQQFEANREVQQRILSTNERLLSSAGYIGDVGINTVGI